MDWDETENLPFKPLYAALSRAVSTSGQSRPSTCPSGLAADRAGILLGCYRKGDAEDAQIYAGAVAATLSCYPQAIAVRVTDPRSGLPNRSQWLPTVAEVRAACEAEMAPVRAAEARRKREAESRDYLAGPESGRVSAARWKALADSLQSKAVRQNIGPKSEEWLREYGQAPIAISDALKSILMKDSCA